MMSGVIQFVVAAFVVVTNINTGNCQQVLEWDPNIIWDQLTVEENTPINTNIFNISISDLNTYVEYEIIKGIDYFRFAFGQKISSNGRMYLFISPDYENIQQIPISVKATPLSSLISPIQRDANVKVININDGPPTFSQQRYSAYISEEAPVGTVVFEFSVVDRDYANRFIRVTCERTHPTHGDACNTFQLEPVGRSSNIQWNGKLVLVGPVDYEQKSFYQVPLLAEDGLFKANISMKITLNNTQDTPPEFVDIQSATVPEEQPVGSFIQQVIAYDGDYPQDPSKGNKIRYEFAPNQGDVYPTLFEIGADDGIIRNKKVLDLETDTDVYPDGTFEVIIVAREVDKKTGAVGMTNKNSTRSMLRVTITDINDNRPTFTKTNFEVTLPEDTPKDSTLTNVNLNVSDVDVTKKNARFSLTLIPATDIFDISTRNVERRTTANIIIKNSTALDFETLPNRYILYVIAEEGSFTPTTATVTVNIVDVNDNVPVFQPPKPYEAYVLENATVGTRINVTIRALDKDSGQFGTSGIVYSLSGAGSNLFNINPKTGHVTVADCATPGVKPCIDFEDKNRKYELGVTAVDNAGHAGYRSAYEILIIHVLDVNDNVPRFPDGLNLTSFIMETRTSPNPPVTVSATDADEVGGPVSYSLVSGTDYWQIDSTTGVVTAKVPMKYDFTPGKSGFFRFTAMATDNKYNVTTEITIKVLEVNDNPPIFQQQIYRETISEGQRGKDLEYILTVSATDADSATSSAGVINYQIAVGSQGKFKLNSTTGVLTTAESANFDFETQKVYNMTVVARDEGIPSQSGTAYVIINIRNENNKNPYIKPETRRADIYENVVVGTSVLQVIGEDPDGGKLSYKFVEPKTAITPDGIVINRNIYDYTNLFKINASNGMITTAAPLDRDKASVVTYTMEVEDITASPRQTGTGTLIITILEYNDQPPRFLPYRNVTISEDQPTGTFVMALRAIDEDDAISEYRMFESPQNFFTIGMYTGVVVTTDTTIDYEQIEETYFIVQVFDDGVPRLSATASVHVTILNVNDNSPRFDNPSYSLNFPENAVGGRSLLRVHATDDDKGHYGEVKYFLTDPLNRFYMNNETGEIFVSPGAVLDREATPSIDILVTAYDSQLDPSVRRFTEVSIFMYLDDVNDNPPKFKVDDYIIRIPETIPINTEIFQVAATDRDLGINAFITFSKVRDSGDPQDFFALNTQTGRIRVSKSLLRQTGTYKFQVMARDSRFNTTANVTVIVFEAANSQPIWVIPPKTNMTIEVLESQYLGMLVFQVSARDDDRGTNGLIDYGFSVGNQTFTAISPEFRINPLTGVIRAERVFDREERDRYVLILVARDRGNPYLETQRSLTVVILDVNDNVPVFPRSGDGQTIPYRFQVSEDAPSGSRINAVTATDADLNPEIYYYIIGGNEHGTFFLNKTSGEIFLNKQLDRETQAIYRLFIQATNNISDYTVITNRKKRELDPSIAEVVITVGNTNDVPPVFTQERYHGCISEEAPVQQSIVQVQAIDKDAYGNIRYRITQGNTGGALSIDPINGIITNNILMQNQENFLLDVQADDSAGGVTLSAETAAKVLIFVTQKTKEVKLVIRQPASEVRTFIANYQTMLQKFERNNNNKYFDYICFSDIRDHVMDDGQSTTLWSDVYLSAICANCFNRNYYIYTTDELLRELTQLKNDNKDTFDMLYIKDMEPALGEESYIDSTPTLVVMIIIILLFILIIVFLIIACCCIQQSSRKKKALIHRHHVEEPTFEPVVVEKSVNPVYDNRGYEPEEPHAQYAQVLKRREMEPEQIPEAEPSPRYSDQSATMEVEIKDDSSPERSPPESPRVVDPADEEFVIETQVL